MSLYVSNVSEAQPNTTNMKHARPQEQGFTLFEMLIIIAILGIILALAGWGFFNRNVALEESRKWHSEMMGLRSQAMANTEARRMIWLNNKTVKIQRAKRCSAPLGDWEDVKEMKVKYDKIRIRTNQIDATDSTNLPSGSRPVVCFTSRGLASKNGHLNVTDIQNRNKYRYRVEVAIGGGVRTIERPKQEPNNEG